MQHRHKGARNEHAAILWLLEQGYEVFRNVSQHGPIDIVAVKDGETIFIDVKASHATKFTATPEQLQLKVKFLVPFGDEFLMVIPNERPDTITCPVCGKEFPNRKGGRKFCSSRCWERSRQ